MAESVEREWGAEFNDMHLHYSHETQPLGTGGALRKALRAAPLEKPRTAVAMNGDTYLALNWEKLMASHRMHKADLTLALTYARDSRRFGTVALEGDKPISFLEKGATRSGWINGGVYVLSAKAQAMVQSLPVRASLEHDFFSKALSELRCHAYRSRARFIDIGIPEDFARAQRMLA
jgi:D-glycero-alpha-D-manno-heptose 1-phosphate guanylyltransferase